MIKDSTELNEHCKEMLPPSILRPPDISDIFLRILNESSLLNHPQEFSSNIPVGDKGSHLIIPRPKVGWPLRKVTFGKSNLALKSIQLKRNNKKICKSIKYESLFIVKYLFKLI